MPASQLVLTAACCCLNFLPDHTPLQDAKVAAYMSGHDHDLQFITRQSDPSVSDSAPVWPAFVVSGAGSSVRNNEFGKMDRKVRPASNQTCRRVQVQYVECTFPEQPRQAAWWPYIKCSYILLCQGPVQTESISRHVGKVAS
jgi:hypothetical protein